MKISINAAAISRHISLACLLLALSAFAPGGPADAPASSLRPRDIPGGTVQKEQTIPDITLPQRAQVSEHLFGLAGLKNVGRVAPGVYRGAQPASEGYATLRKMGIKTVVNLRTTLDEKKAVEAAGMKSVEIPMEMATNGYKEKVDKAVAIMADPANRPVFVHCKLGQDRTGIVVAAYRMKVEGWSLNLAEAEMESFGFHDMWVNLRHFLHKYAARLEQRNRAGTATAEK